MTVLPGFVPETLTLDPGQWTEVRPPITCDSVAVTNAGAGVMELRLVSGDSTRRIRIGPGVNQLIAAPRRGGVKRFISDEVAFFLKPDSGTGPAELLWA